MANDVQSQVRNRWTKVRNDVILSPSIMKEAGKRAGALSVDLVRKRTMLKVGYDGKALPKPSKIYKKQKERWIKGGTKKRKKGSRSSTDDNRTPFAATDADDRGRRTGRALSDIGFNGVKVSRSAGQMQLTWNLTASTKRRRGGSSSAEILRILDARGYKIMGLATTGPFARKERDAINRLVADMLALNATAKGIIVTRKE